MQMLAYEIKKVFGNRIAVLLFLFAVVLNGLIGVFTAYMENPQRIRGKKEYDLVFQQLNESVVTREELQCEYERLSAFCALYYRISDSDNGELTEIELEDNEILNAYRTYFEEYSIEHLLQQMAVYKEALEQLEYFDEYIGFREQIGSRAERAQKISLWSKKDSYSLRNIRKTAEDFVRLKTDKLCPGPREGIIFLGKAYWTDWLLILWSVFLTIAIYKWEEEKGAVGLLQSCRSGRFRLSVTKLTAFLLLEIVAAVVLCAENILLAAELYGFGPLARNIQSISEFRGCGLYMTVGQYIEYFLSGKLVMIICLAEIFGMLMVLSSGIFIPAGLWIAFLLGEYLLRVTIPIHSPLRIMYEINLFGYADLYELIRTYNNLNICGYPVPVTQAWLLLSTVIFLMAPFFIVLRYTYNRRAGRHSSRLKKCFDRLYSRCRPFFSDCASHSVWFWEWKNYMIRSGSLFTVLAGAAVLYLITGLERDCYGIRREDAIYEAWIREYTGVMTEEKQSEIEDWERYFRSLPERKAEIEKQYENGELTQEQREGKLWIIGENEKKQGGFYRFYEEYQSGGRQWGMISSVAWEQLVKEASSRNVSKIVLILFAVVLSASAVSRELQRQVMQAIRSTGKGRGQIFLFRTLICIVLIWVLTGIRMYLVCQIWGKTLQMDEWGMAIQSVPQYRDCVLPLSVGEWLALNGIVQCMGMSVICLVVTAVSVYLKQVQKTCFVGAAFFSVPYLLAWMGIPGKFYFGLDKFLDLEQLHGENVARLAATTVVASLFWIVAWRYFQCPDRRRYKKDGIVDS